MPRSNATNIGASCHRPAPDCSAYIHGPTAKGLITAALDTRCQNASSAITARPSKPALCMDPRVLGLETRSAKEG